MEWCFQFAPGVLEPLGSRGYHAEMKNGLSLTLEPLKYQASCKHCWCCGNITMPPLQEGESRGQYRAMYEIASGPCSGHEMKDRKTTLLWWGCRRKTDVSGKWDCARRLWMASAPKPPEQGSPRPLPRKRHAAGLSRQLVVQQQGGTQQTSQKPF